MKKMKYVLGVLAIAMALCLPVAIAAGDSSSGYTTGSSDVEGVVATDVFSVVIPTLAAGDTTYKFHIDPNQMIAQTGAARYGKATVEDGATVMFTQNDTGTAKFASRSNILTVTNKSTFGVTAKVEAEITGSVDATDATKKIDFVAKATTTPDANGKIPAEIIMKLAKYTKTVNGKVTTVALDSTVPSSDVVAPSTASGLTAEEVTALTAAGVKAYAALTMDLGALAERDTNKDRIGDAYEFVYANGKYSYELKSAFTGTGTRAYDFEANKNAANFALSATANTESTEWESAKALVPQIKVKWKLQPTEYDITPVDNSTGTANTVTYDETNSKYVVKDTASTPVEMGSFQILDGSTAITAANAGKRFKVVFETATGKTYAVKSMTLTPTATDIGNIPNTDPAKPYIDSKTLDRTDTGWFNMLDSDCSLSMVIVPYYTMTIPSSYSNGSATITKADGTDVTSTDKFFEGDKITVTVTPDADKTATVKFDNAETNPDTTGGATYTYTVGTTNGKIEVTFA